MVVGIGSGDVILGTDGESGGDDSDADGHNIYTHTQLRVAFPKFTAWTS